MSIWHGTDDRFINGAANIRTMKNGYPLALLREQWRGFLESYGHRVLRVEDVPDVVVSNSNKHNSFRWLLFVAVGKIKRLRRQERRNLASEIACAEKERQKPYVVVYFPVPEPKVVIQPAAKAMRTGRIESTRGGIAWLG